MKPNSLRKNAPRWGKLLTAALAVLSAFVTMPAQASRPIRSEAELAAPVRETAVRVKTARIVLADYGLIKKDFAETHAMSDAQIDSWLLSKTAYISKTQATQTIANSPIQAGDETTQALRPRGYGRALVYETGNGGWIDAKGTGAATAPLPGGHSDGLATLGEATREFLYEKLVSTVLAHSGSSFETVGHYAVVDWGFDVKHANGALSPAGMVLRQAHSRAPGLASVLDDTASREVELTLRRYGLTSAGAYRSKNAVELVNIQGTPDQGILDFGGYLSVEKFQKSARNFFSFKDLLTPAQIDFVQPNATIRVSFEKWGYGITGIEDPKFDNPWVWSHELARDFRAGVATRAAFKTHFENLVGSYRRELSVASQGANQAIMETLVRAAEEVH